ncbi:MAG: hypothetical protein HN929_11155 [Chloroflexi bacterium]|jgi:hypothetical protein|nr:hypothetical protein [Chloroflexota bacterium]MBT7081998.1 hypothetical protein [Chloroflexota bacterium]MBT7290724.1 hypothetical protein [Chloroflexota bacterium]
MQKTTDKQQTRECCHYWVLEQPQNGLTKGMCKLCGMVKEFVSSGLWTKGDTSTELNIGTA